MHRRWASPPACLPHRLSSLNGAVTVHPPGSRRLKRTRRNVAVGPDGNPLHCWPIDKSSSQGLFLPLRNFMAMKKPLPLLVDEQVFNRLLFSNCSDRNNIVSKGSTPKEECCLHEGYDYTFKNQSTVAECITRASAALATNGLGNEINSSITDDNQSGIVYGWNRNGTENAEIKCNRGDKISFLGYAAFSDDPGSIFKKWTLLRDSDWQEDLQR